MNNFPDLPEPSADAAAHSAALSRLITQRIQDAGGWVDFSVYMDLALTAPGLGYYSAGARKFGAAGDFVTAPELSELFGLCLARVAGDFLEQNPGAVLIEIGAGTGALASVMLPALAARGVLPARYRILEISADLRERQYQCLAERIPDLVKRIEWIDRWPAEPQHALVLANEILDALPVSRFRLTNGELQSLGVTHENGRFAWAPAPASESLQRAWSEISKTNESWPSRYTSEVSTTLKPWMSGLSAMLDRGLVLLIDYGLPRSDYYHPDRGDGTLMCHYRHRAHGDPFYWPGLQDISAWVEFTAVAEAAAAAGLNVAGYTTQAEFLIGAGIAKLAGAEGADGMQLAKTAREVRQLMLPGEMGEKFKVMLLQKDAATVPASFAGRDLRHLL